MLSVNMDTHINGGADFRVKAYPIYGDYLTVAVFPPDSTSLALSMHLSVAQAREFSRKLAAGADELANALALRQKINNR